MPVVNNVSRAEVPKIISESRISIGVVGNIKKIHNVSINEVPGVFKHDGVTISRTGHAKQLVIMTHGGWKEFESSATLLRRQVGDGWTNVPLGLRVDFYTEDKNFTKGASVLSEVNRRPKDALNGLEFELSLSDSDLELLSKSRNKTVDSIQEEMKSFAVYKKDGANEGDLVKNYALYYHDSTEALLKEHQKQPVSKDVDIAFVTDKKHKKHLSDVFNAIKTFGLEYSVIHFGACRVERTSSAIPTLE
ncbi:MAG: putative adhesin [Shewanella sp.]